jgi:hypothetical protein
MKCYTVTEDKQTTRLVIEDEGVMSPEPRVTIGAPGASTVLTLEPELERLFTAACEKLELKRLELARCDLIGRPVPRLARESGRDSRALVHVATIAGPGGRLWFEANSYKEFINKRGRVDREYDTFPPPGVEVVVTGMGPSGEPQGLFIMSPGSSFRICRNGALEGASPVLIVAWPGSSLRVFPPKKYEEKAA